MMQAELRLHIYAQDEAQPGVAVPQVPLGELVIPVAVDSDGNVQLQTADMRLDLWDLSQVAH